MSTISPTNDKNQLFSRIRPIKGMNKYDINEYEGELAQSPNLR